MKKIFFMLLLGSVLMIANNVFATDGSGKNKKKNRTKTECQKGDCCTEKAACCVAGSACCETGTSKTEADQNQASSNVNADKESSCHASSNGKHNKKSCCK